MNLQLQSHARMAPYCETCKHHHEQGVKCSICGHIGRSTIFLKMKEKAIRGARVRCEVHGSEIFANPSSGLSDLVVELRKTIHNEAFESSIEEMASRHFIGFLGDAPICVSRFHMIDDLASYNNNGASAVVIDRFGVLPSHRGSGFGKQCFEALIADIRTHLNTSARIILKLPREHTATPMGSTLVEKLCSSSSASVLQLGAYAECQPFPQPDAFVSLDLNC